VSSRQQEKERRRQERLEREQAERKSAANKKRLQLVGGVVLGLAAIAAVAVALVVGLGGDDDETTAGGTSPSDASAAVKLPEQKTSDLDAAAKAAGCTLTHAEYEGAGHEEKDFKPSDYKTNPPTSGAHFPEWYDDGVYAPGTVPKLGMLVHTLEHGRIDVQYKEGTSADDVGKLEALLAESDGYHMLLFENTTGMDAQVAATAWGHSLTCPEMNDEVFDAIRTFRAEYIDQGPEDVP
jgi:Protein of unknown function (DUF3105)